jgi:hypothetical protein
LTFKVFEILHFTSLQHVTTEAGLPQEWSLVSARTHLIERIDNGTRRKEKGSFM